MLKKPPLVLRIVFFIAIFLLINHVIMRAYIRYTRQPFVYEGNRRGFEAVMADTSFLVLGDSHTLNSVYTPWIPGSYNFSTNGESYIHTYYKMRHYLKSDQLDLDVVVMPVSFHTFSGMRVDEFLKLDPAFWDQYVDYIQMGIETDRLWPFLLERVKAEFAYIGGLEEIFEIFYKTNFWLSNRLRQGYLLYNDSFSDQTEEEMTDAAVGRARYHYKGYDYIDPLVVDYFNRLLDLLEAEGVQVVLVNFPTSSPYQEVAAEYLPIEDHMAQMEALVEGRENVLLLDYHDMFADRLDVFRDADHLNTSGAKILTQRLLADLQKNGITWEVRLQP